MRPAEQRGLRGSARDQHDVVRRGAERAHLAAVREPVAEMGLRVRDEEALVALCRYSERRELTPVPPGGAVRGAVDVARTRHVGGAGHHRAVAHDADAHAPRRKPGHERRRPVDRVDHDAVRADASVRRSFLPDDPGVGHSRRELGGQERLDLAVGPRDEAPVRLPLDLDLAKMAERDVPAPNRKLLELRPRRQPHPENQHDTPRQGKTALRGLRLPSKRRQAIQCRARLPGIKS